MSGYWDRVASSGRAATLGITPVMVPIQHRAKVFPELAPPAAVRRRTARRSPRPLARPMRKVEAGVYETEDGAYRVLSCTYDYYCSELGHPIRTGKYSGQWCPGDQWHTRPGWMIRERNEHGGYTDVWLGGLAVYTTMREAVEVLPGQEVAR